MTVATLSPRVLAVPYEQHPVPAIEVTPFCPADLVLSHRRCHGESYQTPDRDQLTGVCFERSDYLVKLALDRPAIALVALADQPEPVERYPSQLDLFGRCRDAMHGGCMK